MQDSIKLGLTFFLVDSEDDDDFIAAHSDELLYTPYSSSREFCEKNHSLYVIVFQLRFREICGPNPSSSGTDQFYICSHFCDLTNLYHDEFINFWIFWSVITHDLVEFKVDWLCHSRVQPSTSSPTSPPASNRPRSKEIIYNNLFHFSFVWLIGMKMAMERKAMR